MPARTDTSSIETGSSATSSLGSSTSADAIATRCRWPPESSCGKRSRNSSAGREPGALERLAHALGALLLVAHAVDHERLGHGVAHAVARVERLVGILEHDLRLAPQRAQLRAPRAGRCRVPSISTEPERGTSMRMTACAVVVLPQPDSPTSATSSPAATVSEMPSTARTTRSSVRADRADEPARQRVVDDEVAHVQQRSGAHAAESARWQAARWPAPTGSSGRAALAAGLEGRVAARRERAGDESAGRAAAGRPGSTRRRRAGEIGRGREQHARVGMPRRVVQRDRRAELGDAAGVHDGGRLAGLRDDRQVVRDQDDREPELVGEPRQELQDLRLHHHVERGRRLVGEQHARLSRRAPSRSRRAGACRPRTRAGSAARARRGCRRARAARRSGPARRDRSRRRAAPSPRRSGCRCA